MFKLLTTITITLALGALTACNPLSPPVQFDTPAPATVDVVEAPVQNCHSQDDPSCPPPPIPVDTTPAQIAGCNQDNQDAQDCQPPTTTG